MGGFLQDWDWQENVATIKAGQEHMPCAEHVTESIYCAACLLLHQTKSQS